MILRELKRTWVVILVTCGLIVAFFGGMTSATAAQEAENIVSGLAVEWDAPWQPGTTNLDGSIPADNRLNLWTDDSYFVLEVLDAKTPIRSATDAVLTEFAVDPANGVEVAGGSGESVSADGAVTTKVDYRVFLINKAGEDIGIYVQLDGGVRLTVLLARPDAMADQIAAAQSGIRVDGTGVFQGADGASAASSLMSRAGEAPPIAVQDAGTDEAAGGEYTDQTGNVHVTWPAGWTTASSDENGIFLQNAEQTMQVYVQGVAFDGQTWEQAAADTQAWLLDDQGANAVTSELVITDSGFMFTTDGEYGPRLVQAVPSADPEMHVLIFAANIQPGSDLNVLATVAQSIMVNDVPALQGIEAVFAPAA